MKYPEIHVQLTGNDGNAFGIIAAVNRALRKNGVPPTEISAFMDECMSGDYDHLLDTCMEWVDVL